MQSKEIIPTRKIRFLISLLSFFLITITLVAQQRKTVPPEFLRPIPLKIHEIFHTQSLITNPPLKSFKKSNLALEVNLSPMNAGIWLKAGDNYQWFLKLRCRDAQRIALIIQNTNISEGDELFIYSETELISYIHEDIPVTRILPIPYFEGEELTIQFTTTKKNSDIPFKITNVAAQLSNARDNNDCQPNLSCIKNPNIQKIGRSVVKLLIHQDVGTRLCTGCLINNTNQDRKPYILTAWHCIRNQYEADRTVISFSEQLSNCQETSHQTVNFYGAKFLAGDQETDFALIELRSIPSLSASPIYAGWSINNHYLDHVFSIHYPYGSKKSISNHYGLIHSSDFPSTSSYTPNAFWHIDKWSEGYTDIGSSGGPLFNMENKIIGSLTGGASTCESPYNDYYERLSISWDRFPEPEKQLKFWLDPHGNRQSLNSYDPYEGLMAICDTLNNYSDKTLQISAYENGTGYFGGVNSDSIRTYGEYLNFNQVSYISGMILHVGQVNRTASGGIVLTVKNLINHVPNNSLFEKFIPYSDFASSETTFFMEIYPPISGKEFFASFEIQYSEDDNFVMQQAIVPNNSAFALLNGAWTPFKEINQEELSASFGIEVISCESTDISSFDDFFDHPLLYPNPAQSLIKLPLLPHNFLEKIIIIDTQGREHPVTSKWIENEILIDTSGLASGIYILVVVAGNDIYKQRFIKE